MDNRDGLAFVGGARFAGAVPGMMNTRARPSHFSAKPALGLLPILTLLAALIIGAYIQTAWAQTATETGICSRTVQVRDAILNQFSTGTDCADVSAADLGSIRQLNLNSRGITVLRSGDFDGLSSLTELSLISNQLTMLPAGLFDGLSRLRSLNLRVNRLTALPGGLFDGLPNLAELDLASNRLTTLPAGIFDSLSNLTRLRLDSNSFTTLPVGLFDNLSNLEWLILDSNSFTTLPNGLFDGLSNLTRLWLNGNRLTTLPNGLFDSLSNLTSLILRDNQLTALPVGLFNNLSSLRYLDLSVNRLTTLLSDVFNNLPRLTRLHLYGNQLATLPAGIFDSLSDLTELRLSTNRFTTLVAGLFDGLSSLTTLSLAGNQFTPGIGLSRGIFDDVLDTLGPITTSSRLIQGIFSIDDNVRAAHFVCSRPDSAAIVAATAGVDDCLRITAAQLDAFLAGDETPEPDNETGICSRTAQVRDVILTQLPAARSCENVSAADLRSIRQLDLANTGITALQSGDFVGLSGLEDLRLDRNRLTTLPGGVFDSLSSLTNLDLGNNRLTRLPAGLFDRLSNLRTLWLNINRLTTLPAGLFDRLSNLRTLWLNNNQLTRLPGGLFDSLSSLMELNLFSNRLTALPAGLFDNLSNLRTLALLSNRLTALPAGLFDRLSRLRTLALHGNRLTTLPGGLFDRLSRLTSLNLSDNRLTALPGGIFDGLSSLTDLRLNNNQFTSGTGLPKGIFDNVLDTLGPITTSGTSGFVVDTNVRAAHFACSRPDSDAIVAATAGVDDCLRITAAQFDAFLDATETPEPESMDATFLVRQYLQTTSASVNETALHIVNTSAEPQRFTGSLFARNGEPLGEADQSLGMTVAPNGRLILGSGDLERFFGVSPWRGPAMLEVAGTTDFKLMSRLTSPSGLVSNTNCVREDRVLNVEGFDSPDRTYVRFINVTNEPLGEVRGTLYDRQGEIVGQRNALLLASVAPKAQVFLTRDDLAALVGAPAWSGEAMLEVMGRFPQTADGGSGLKLLNLNLVADTAGGASSEGTFFNFSCFEDSTRDVSGDGYGRVYLQTTSTSQNVSLTHLVNTSALRQSFTGSLYAAGGERLGPVNRPLHGGTIRGRARLVLSSADLEDIFGVSPWVGPAMLEVRGSDGPFVLMTKLRSPSGLVSNTNCVRREQVHNIVGTDSPDRTFIRFINIGEDSLTNIRGTLYDGAGEVIGSRDILLLETLAPKAQVWLDRDDLADLAGDTWQGTASLVIAPQRGEALASLRLLNLNFVNNETFFNFSCYEESLQPR